MFHFLVYQLLRRFAPRGGKGRMYGSAFSGLNKASVLLGPTLARLVKGSVVVDFGCGEGNETVKLLELGASHAIGVDIQPRMLASARRNAISAGVEDRVTFTRLLDSPADIIVSLDGFEHFEDPESILSTMASMLATNGKVLISFGPTWYHPLGGHLFSVFPWAHLVLPEKSLIRWRADFKDDGASRYAEVAGGLNQMTIAHFERAVESSNFEFETFELVPIRVLRRFHSRWNREFTTAIVRATLRKRASVRTGVDPISWTPDSP